MKFVCISDTHLKEIPELPDGDVLIHAGDLTFIGNEQQLAEANKTLFEISKKFKHKILVPGNHDKLFMKNYEVACSFFPGWKILVNESTIIDGVKIWGSPVTPRFAGWAYEAYGSDRRTIFNSIPMETDIVVTHGPPYGVRDECLDFMTEMQQSVGCQHLKEAIERVKPKYHVFGHIHEGYGVSDTEHTKYINVALCDEKYNLVNKPIVFEL